MATLVSSLRHEDSLETDLLEKWTEFLTEIEPETEEMDFNRSIQSYTDILESVACLLERENTYPNSLLNLLAQYSIRQLIQHCDEITPHQLSKLAGITSTPCFQRSIDTKTVEYGLLNKLIESNKFERFTDVEELSERELKNLESKFLPDVVNDFPATIKEIIRAFRAESERKIDDRQVK